MCNLYQKQSTTIEVHLSYSETTTVRRFLYTCLFRCRNVLYFVARFCYLSGDTLENPWVTAVDKELNHASIQNKMASDDFE